MQLLCPGMKDTGFCEDNSLYEDFNMEEVDLNLEKYEELFGIALSHSEQLFEHGGIDSLFGKKDTYGADIAEVLSLHFIFSQVFSSYPSQQLSP